MFNTYHNNDSDSGNGPIMEENGASFDRAGARNGQNYTNSCVNGSLDNEDQFEIEIETIGNIARNLNHRRQPFLPRKVYQYPLNRVFYLNGVYACLIQTQRSYKSQTQSNHPSSSMCIFPSLFCLDFGYFLIIIRNLMVC